MFLKKCAQHLNFNFLSNILLTPYILIFSDILSFELSEYLNKEENITHRRHVRIVAPIKWDPPFATFWHLLAHFGTFWELFFLLLEVFENYLYFCKFLGFLVFWPFSPIFWNFMDLLAFLALFGTF